MLMLTPQQAEPAAPESLTARVAASPMFWGALSTGLSSLALAMFLFGDLRFTHVAIFCVLMAAGWVASCIRRIVDPEPRADRGAGDGGGWWWGDGDGGWGDGDGGE